MKITLNFKETIYDCKIKITDSQGTRYYYTSPLSEEKSSLSASLTVEVFDSDFLLTLIPVMVDANSALEDFEVQNWKDKLAKKASKLLISTLDKAFLRVGCDYKITGTKDGDRLDISSQIYSFGNSFTLDFFGLMPVLYNFFEVSSFGRLYKLSDAYETNRKSVLKFARAIALSDIFGIGFITLLFTYPLQMGRVKHLTKNKKVKKVLLKFNSLTDEKREAFLKKQEKMISK